jgi:hypothetical protein
MSNRDDGWQWLLLGAAIAAFDYWRRYTMSPFQPPRRLMSQVARA